MKKKHIPEILSYQRKKGDVRMRWKWAIRGIGVGAILTTGLWAAGVFSLLTVAIVLLTSLLAVVLLVQKVYE